MTKEYLKADMRDKRVVIRPIGWQPPLGRILNISIEIANSELGDCDDGRRGRSGSSTSTTESRTFSSSSSTQSLPRSPKIPKQMPHESIIPETPAISRKPKTTFYFDKPRPSKPSRAAPPADAMASGMTGDGKIIRSPSTRHKLATEECQKRKTTVRGDGQNLQHRSEDDSA